MKIHAICKSYHGRPVLNCFTLELSEGGVYAITGASGSGKTTLLHILLGLIQPDSGTLVGWSGKRCSAVFQEDRLCGFLTAAENIMIVRPDGNVRDRAAIREMNGLLAELLPEEALAQSVASFSGGMKRRAAVARAVLCASDVLIMDEPFSGLDEETKERTAAFIRMRRNGRTLLFSSHDKGDAARLGAEEIRLE